MVSGVAMSFIRASHAASIMASQTSKTRLESQCERRYCQTFSTGFSSGAREGRRIGVMFSGTSRRLAVCHPAAVEKQHGVGALTDMARDFVEVELHRLGVGMGQGERRADAAGWANRSEQIGVVVALIGALVRARSTLGPLPNWPFFWRMRASS
jgi:hypothetical protein